MEMETEDDVDGNADLDADPPSSAAEVPLVQTHEFQPETAEVAPPGNQELVAS